MIKDFKKEMSVNEDVLKSYSDKLPKELIEIWKSYGFGSIINGYLKIINPDDYVELLEQTYSRGKVSVPIMVTAFGDIITWEKGKYVGIVEYRYGRNDIIVTGFDIFISLLSDESFLNDYLKIDFYKEAVGRFGELSYDECFGYVPILAIGGKETIDSLAKVKIKEHIALITEFIDCI